MKHIKVMRGNKPATPQDLEAAVNGKPLPRILPLTLTRRWFDAIASGKKTEEYRVIKPYWTTRLVDKPFPNCVWSCQCGQTNSRWSNQCGRCESYRLPTFKHFDEVWFTNGYGSDNPFMRLECKGIEIKDSKLEGYGVCYAIKLGKILEVKNYTMSHYWPLFKHMSDSHNLTLLDSEMEDIIQVVIQMKGLK